MCFPSLSKIVFFGDMADGSHQISAEQIEHDLIVDACLFSKACKTSKISCNKLMETFALIALDLVHEVYDKLIGKHI